MQQAHKSTLKCAETERNAGRCSLPAFVSFSVHAGPVPQVCSTADPATCLLQVLRDCLPEAGAPCLPQKQPRTSLTVVSLLACFCLPFAIIAQIGAMCGDGDS